MAIFIFVHGINGLSIAGAGGWCKGDEERFRGLVERAEFNFGMLKEELKAGAKEASTEIIEHAAFVSSWVLYVNALEKVSFELNKADADLGTRLKNDLKDIWIKSDLIRLRGNIKGNPAGSQFKDLEPVIYETLLPFAICRALRAKDPSECRVLDKLESSPAELCVDFFIDEGVLLSGHCVPELLHRAADIWHVPSEYLSERCKIFSSSNSASCADLEFASDIDLASCWAVTSGESKWCLDPELGEKKSLECQKTLLISKAIKNRDYSILKSSPLMQDYEVEAVRALVNTDSSCSEIAMESFTRSVVQRFFLNLSYLGALPSLR